MQLRYETGLTGEEYVSAQAWRDARLDLCPNHPHENCSLARHGTYARKTPRGTHIARWYCPESHTTFSLLPDCLAARLPGELDTLEAVVAHAEQAPSLAAAANALRRDAVELPGAMRWVERRVRLVHHVVSIVIGLLPNRSPGASPRWARCAHASRPMPRSEHCALSSRSNSPCCPHRWGAEPPQQAIYDALTLDPEPGGIRKTIV